MTTNSDVMLNLLETGGQSYRSIRLNVYILSGVIICFHFFVIVLDQNIQYK